MPQAVLDRWRKESETDDAFRKSVEEYLDPGFGECYLARTDIASMVQDALLHPAGSLYRLDAWCVMPNHGHVLLQPLPGVHLSDVMHSVKSFTAHEANKILQRQGQFWQKEYFDRHTRNAKHYIAVIRYIENNPVEVGLCDFPWEWKHSSASYKREQRLIDNWQAGRLRSSRKMACTTCAMCAGAPVER